MRLGDLDALEKATKELYNETLDGIVKFGIEKVYELIHNAPTVEYTFEEAFQKTVCESRLYCPERPQGEWIITREEQGAFGIIYKMKKCNKCGWESSLLIPRNFCPNCGADMRGDKE